MRTQLLVGTSLLAALAVGLAIAQQGGPPAQLGGNQFGPPPGGPPPSPLIAALDTDKDGTISAAELKNASASLAALDRSGDGALSPEELRPALGPREGRDGGRRGGPGAGDRPPGGQRDAVAGAAPLPKDDAEKKIFAVLEEMNQNRRGMMSVPLDDGRFLRMLVECVGARNVVEIGTSHGYSGIWMCLALGKTGGKLTTFEIDAGRAALARQNFKRAGVDSLVTLVEGDAHDEVKQLKDPIDILFLDADKEGYIDYLQKLLPLVRPGGLIVAHNMSLRQADPRYVKAITTDPNLETLFVTLSDSGIGVTLKKH